MNRPTAPSNGSIVPYVGMPFPNGLEICWAGEFTAPDPTVPPLFSFGTTNGKVLFSDQDLSRWTEGKGPASGSGEAINGIAQLGPWVAVSTRIEVSFWGTTHSQGCYSPLGAHGVTTTSSGCFIAPLGQSGFLTARPSEQDVSLAAHTPGDGSFYVYRVISLRSKSGADVLVCAIRRDGLAAGEFNAAQQANPMTTARFENVDVIDVCPVCPDRECLAVAALGRDGSIILCRDILSDRKTKAFKFQKIKGIAYRIVSHKGDIYVLTSQGLYVLGQLGSRFINGERMDAITTPVMPLPLKAVDMNPAWGRWLLVVLDDEILRFDLDQIHAFVPDHIENGEIKEVPSTAISAEPRWETIDSKTTSLALIG